MKRLQQEINSLLEENAAGSTSAAPLGDDDMDFDMFDDAMLMMDETSGSAGGRKHVIFSDDLEAGSSRSSLPFTRSTAYSAGSLRLPPGAEIDRVILPL